MTISEAVQELQTVLNLGGGHLTVDGVMGPLTLAELEHQTKAPVPPVIPAPAGSAPWMDWMKARNGWTEFDHDQELSQYWKFAGLPQYKTVIGTAHAWCALTINAALHDTGFKGNNRADALSFEKYGTPCEYTFGAIIPMRHASGGSHVTFFDHWVDEVNRVAACFGGNQGDALKISNFNLSGNKFGHDQCVSGPRWPLKV